MPQAHGTGPTLAAKLPRAGGSRDASVESIGRHGVVHEVLHRHLAHSSRMVAVEIDVRPRRTPLEAHVDTARLYPAILDRIDEIFQPGVNLNPADAGYGEQVLTPTLRRR